MYTVKTDLLGGQPINALFCIIGCFTRRDFYAFGSAMETQDIVFTVFQVNWK